MLCILDSDRISAQGPLGETARRVFEHGLEGRRKNVEAIILSVRELENLMPLSFFYNVYAADENVRRRLDCYYAYLKKYAWSPENVVDFVDIKLGHTIEQIASFDEEIGRKFALLAEYFETLPCEFVRRAGVEEARAVFPLAADALRQLKAFLESQPRVHREFKRKLSKAPCYDGLLDTLGFVVSYGASMGRVSVG